MRGRFAGRRVMHRQRKYKSAASYFRLVHPNAATVSFDGQTAEGQPEAGRVPMFSTAIDLAEFFENTFSLVNWNADPVVRDTDCNASIVRH